VARSEPMAQDSTRRALPVARSVQTVDYHTAGEPFRIVIGGVPALRGATVLDRRGDARDRLDDVRAFLVNEPRGHADMYGGFVTDPDPGEPAGDGVAALGVVFFHKDGFSTACGHGTIALATWALETGVVPATSPLTRLAVDVPSGRLAVEADVGADGRVGEVRFTNVASWVAALDVALDLALDVERGPAPGGPDRVLADIAYGGAFYAVVAAAAVGERVAPGSLPALIAHTRRLQAALAGHPAVTHPDDDRLSGCYGVVWTEPVADGPPLHLRNVTVFADGEVDRSPCGSGTSARLAVLHARGRLPTGAELCHEGIVGTTFRARVLGTAEGPGGRPAVITQVGGRAHRTGYHTFVLDPDDPIGLGFQLR
jgi:proline racemase